MKKLVVNEWASCFPRPFPWVKLSWPLEKLLPGPIEPSLAEEEFLSGGKRGEA